MSAAQILGILFADRWLVSIGSVAQIDTGAASTVSFTPIWRASSEEGPSDAEVHDLVASATEELLRSIDFAAQRSNQWTNQALGYAAIDAAMSGCLAQLARTRRWGRDNEIPSDILWKAAGDVLQVGWLQHRARSKPLGYAGDYQMITNIVEDRCCEDPLGAIFDRYFLNQAAPHAVRNRTEQVAYSLADHFRRQEGGPYRIVSVGAGPAIDIQRGMSLLPRDDRKRANILLLDLDDESLTYATERLDEVVDRSQIVAARENLFRLPRNAGVLQQIREANFLVCSGLLDYLDDNVATDMLQLFWKSLAREGLMLVGNFVPYHPTRAYMEWIGNWYLQYRTPDQLTALVAAAGIPAKFSEILADRSGSDLFVHCINENRS